mgnify:CR=1 FL=1
MVCNGGFSMSSPISATDSSNFGMESLALAMAKRATDRDGQVAQTLIQSAVADVQRTQQVASQIKNSQASNSIIDTYA